MSIYQYLPDIAFAGEFVVKAGLEVPTRRLFEYTLIYFPAASATAYTINQQRYILHEPCIILSRPQDECLYQFDPVQPVRHLFVHFTMLQQSELSLLQDSGPVYLPIREGSLTPGLLSSLLTLAYKMPYRWQIQSRCLLWSVLEELECYAISVPEVKPVMPVAIVQAVEQIHERSHEVIDIGDLAESVGWTHQHFTRVFTRTLGIAPREFILRERVRKAAQLLLRENWNVKRIAKESGFQDQYYFSRMFTRIMHVSPTDYRKKYSDLRTRNLAPVYDQWSAYPLNQTLIFS